MKNDIHLFNNILGTAERAFSSTNFYWQSISVFSCLIIAVISYKFFKKLLPPKDTKRKKSNNLFSGFFYRYLIPLFLPILIIFALSIGAVIFFAFFEDVFLFLPFIQILALFTFLRFLRILFNSSLIANLVGFFLIPAIFLNILGILEPTIIFLDQFAINIGKVRISIYSAIQSFMILSVVFWLSGIISRKTKSYFSKSKDLKASTKGIISKFIDITLYFAIFVIILQVFGVDMTTFAVLGGAIGVGIGFGLQKIASNFISGIILLLEKSVEVGDLVDLDDGATYGTIARFSGRYTLIETFDGKEIMVPNEDFITNKVTNWTYNNNRGRIDIDLKISYDSDIKKAKEIILKSASEHPRCLKYPAPEFYVTEFSDNGIELVTLFWIGDVSGGRRGPKSDVMINILDGFKENGIKIPLPQREILVKNNSPEITKSF
ncbi:MAG: small-conductance mechanosensitive channel [Rickettsiales bacterium]|jgi:small-conductance mechanosensitive channel